MADTDPSAPLTGIRERYRRCGNSPDIHVNLETWIDSANDVPALVAALDAVLEQADDLTRKSEALDAEAEYIAGEHPEAAAVAVLKRERSIAYDECARWFREAITTALAGEEAAG